MIQEIINYKNVLNLLEELIEKSPYKKKYIINKVGISSPTFGYFGVRTPPVSVKLRHFERSYNNKKILGLNTF